MKPFDTLPEGLWPVMLTPLQDNNTLDLSGLQELTDMYINAGANGLFTNCLSGEMYQLTEEERLAVIKTVVKQSEGKVPVVATGTFSVDVQTNVEFIRKVYDSGARAVVLITGILAEMNEPEEVLKKRIEAIMQQTGDIPLGLYECPVPYKRLASPQLMQWLAESGRFVYHKDTSCNTGAMEKKMQAVRGSIFGLYNADTPTALDSLEMGARGISPISANFYPELFTYLLQCYRTSGITSELKEYYAMLVVLDKLVHTFYPYSAKLFLQKRGLNITTQSRIPTEYMTQADRLRFDGLFRVFETLAHANEIELVISRKSVGELLN